MLCLGIETSCDETAVALVRDGRLLGQKLASQVDIHALFGGVVPEIASREHLRVLPRLHAELLAETGVRHGQIGAVAVARGPGLLGALLIGVSYAKALSLAMRAPLVGVNHLHAHLLAAGLERRLDFPALGLLVSGGHTHTYEIRSDTDFRLLGKTLDDAAGEAFDKVAKRLNLPYPGGKLLDDLACEATPDSTLFPRAFIDNESLDFSFSGLKTAVVNHVDAHPHLILPTMAGPEALAPQVRSELAGVCASFNWSVVDSLRIKVERALKHCTGVRSLIVAGGVAANSMLRHSMAELAGQHGLELVLPGLPLCTDNAAMIAYAGWRLARNGLRHGLDLEAIPRGRKVPLDWTRGPGKGFS
ncbi:MAG: tRNA (adenosine(37)-N6)-threonylcarbamoyltransferase complex transferase subunit TsaD [Desulfovibrionaceae bacterium]